MSLLLLFAPASASAVTASDDFNRANGALGSNWASLQAGMSIVGNAAAGNGGGLHAMAQWTGSTFGADQWAQGTVTYVSGSQYIGPAVRVNATGQGYSVTVDNGAAYVSNQTGFGTSTVLLTISGTFASGGVLKLGIVGSLLTAYWNGASIGSVTDTTYTTGQPGIRSYGGGSIDNWSAQSGTLPTAVKYWTGSAWTIKPVKRWSGSAWTIKPVKRWDGAAWV